MSKFLATLISIGWLAVIVLTFYGVGVFLWSGKSKPSAGRALLAIVITFAWVRFADFLVNLATTFFARHS